MAETLSWWLIVQLLGVLAFPLTWLLFRNLADGGYAFSKVIGLLLVGYVYWLSGSAGILPNERLSIVLVALAVGIAGAVIAWRQRAELAALIHRRWPVFLAADAVFLAFLAATALLRSYMPEIDGTEKPMDFAFLNAALRADSFPPEDPWLAGHGISYYYFGHLMVAMMVKLSGVAPAVGYNLGVALVAALAATAMFGLVWNLVARVRPTAAYAVGAGAVVLLLLVSNWEGLFELLAIHDLMPGWLFSFLDIDGLSAAATSSTWYPDEFWFWWRASRIVSGWTIREFPFFSFLLGDLHAHVMAMPFFIAACAFAYNLTQRRMALNQQTWLLMPGTLMLGALLLGSLIFLNAWDMPTAAFVIGLTVLIANLRAGLTPARALLGTIGFMLPFVFFALILFSPFLNSYGSAAKFIAPVMVTRSPEYVVEADMASDPVHLLIAWGALFWLVALFLGVSLVQSRPENLRSWLAPLAPILALLTAWAGAVIYDAGFGGLIDEVGERGSAWISLAILAALFWAAGAAVLARLSSWMEDQSSLVFALSLVVAGVLLILGSELFYVEEFAAARLNTVFKLSFQAWILLAAGTAYGLFHAWQTVTLPRPAVPRRLPAFVPRLAYGGLAAITVLFLAAALVYPVISTANRSEGLTKDQTLDGLAFIRDLRPDEYAAVAWLDENVEGAAVILEAPGPDWGEHARISWRTGLPTVIGWPVHEYIWRGSWGPQDGREADVNSIYISDEAPRVMELLRQYGVEYIVVGAAEQSLYGADVSTKFDQTMEEVARFGGLTIYRVPEEESPGVFQP